MEAILKEIVSIDTTVTITEREALILENTLIKKHNPKFNVLLKDGKSYPYIEVSLNHDYPKFGFHRGKKKSKHSRYFGPYPNVYAVRNTLSNLQKIFLLRNCTDSYYKNRSRPCLQFQIKRCSAPCVGETSLEDYSFNVKQALDYLKGDDKTSSIISSMKWKRHQSNKTMKEQLSLEIRSPILKSFNRNNMLMVQKKSTLMLFHWSIKKACIV